VKQKFFRFVGFEVLTAVVVKSSIFWDVTPCGPFKVNRRFGGAYPLTFNGLLGVISQKIELLLLVCLISISSEMEAFICPV
jgi:hypothetical protein